MSGNNCCGNCQHFMVCGLFDIYTEEGTCDLRPFPLPPASRTCPPAVWNNLTPAELPALHGDETRGYVIVRTYYYCSRFESRQAFEGLDYVINTGMHNTLVGVQCLALTYGVDPPREYWPAGK